MKRIVSLLLFAGLCPLAVSAQEAEPGGVAFSFDFAQSFQISTDRDLTTDAAEDGFVGVTTLGFGAVTETRTDRLSFDLGTDLRISDGEFGADGLNAELAYRRISADSEFNVSLRSQRDDIAFLRDVSDFVNADGVIVLPDDFEDLFGSGFRTESVLAASLTWGETAPIGFSVSASQTWLRYEDANAALADADTTAVNFGVRLRIDEVTTGNITLGYSRTDEVGSDLSEVTTLSGGLTFTRPTGELRTRLNAVLDEDGDIFWSATADQTFALPSGSLSGGLGLVQDENRELRLTGRIALSFPQPTGQIDLYAVYDTSPGGGSATATFSASYLQELTPTSRMEIGFLYAQSTDFDGGGGLTTGSVSASYGVDLTPDWQFTVGARYDFRDDGGVARDSTSVFVGLERAFSWRP